MNNLTVTKANDLIDASYQLTVIAQKLVLACISKLNSRDEVPKQITINVSEFSALLGTNSNVRRDLYKAADSLFESTITIKNADQTTRLRWVQKDVIHHKGDGAVTLFWSEDVLQYISQLKTRFTSYKLRNIANLQSTHSIRLYELLMRFKSTKERIISLDNFKYSLGLSNKYSEYKILNRDVIKPAILELNKSSDLLVSVETIKKSRTVVELYFSFKNK